MEVPTLNNIEEAYLEIEKSLNILSDLQSHLWATKQNQPLRKIISAQTKLLQAQKNIALHMHLLKPHDISELSQADAD